MAPRERQVYAYQEESTSEESESGESDVSPQQVALRGKEEELVQSALARIRRAQEKGKVDVKLRQDELSALENRRKRLQAEAAAKAKQIESKSPGDRKKKKSSPAMVTVPLMQPDIQYAAGTDRPTSRRRSKQFNEAVTAAPGVVVEGADGRITYAPIGYPQMQASPGRPRSSSSLSAKAYRQPQQQNPYGYINGGGRHASDGTRPPSAASQGPRPLARGEEQWADSSRRSSLSSQISHDPYDYQIRNGTPPPPIPEDSERHYYIQPSYSQPSGIQYSNVPPGAPYGYGGPRAYAASSSDPTLLAGSSRRHEFNPEDSSGDELSNVKTSSKSTPEIKQKAAAPSRKPVGKKKGKK